MKPLPGALDAMGAGDREHEVVGTKFVEVFVDRGWLGLAVPGAHAPDAMPLPR